MQEFLPADELDWAPGGTAACEREWPALQRLARELKRIAGDVLSSG